MSEFKLHALIEELISCLESPFPPEKIANKIQQGCTLENAPTKDCLRYLEKHSPNPELFHEKYKELKSRKIDGLGSFMQLLQHISNDKLLKDYLERNAIKNNLKKSVIITNDDLPKIRKSIIEAATEGEKKLSKQVNVAIKSIDTTSIKSNWIIERPKMSWDFLTTQLATPTSATPSPLSLQRVVPPASQESILLSDLLNCMKGIDGTYIESQPLIHPYGHRTFTISPDVETSYKQLAQQILPLASYYSMTVRFVEEKVLPEDGQVNHALRGALRCLLKEYLVSVVQLETEHRRGKLNLQALWFYIQPMKATMSVFSQITSTICKANARGGKVLSLLHEQISNMSGDAKCKELCLFLIESASAPYMEILEKWVYKGVICDPYQEFLVEDNELIQREELPMDYSADYWEKRYTMRAERIPAFLNEHAHTILRTGKYFNVIRQCGKTIQWGKQEPLVYSFRDQKFIAAIDRAYSEAARTLLEVLIQENDLMGRLKSVKNYFLLAQGDFVVQFLNLCEPELSKNMYDIVLHRLASLLEVALRTSTSDSDPYKDDLKPELLPYDLQFQMFRILSIQTSDESEFSSQGGKTLTGIEAFVFNYDVKWPVSLIINRKAIACYQMLFRHLFYCKHIERLLCRVWLSNKIAKTFTHEAAMAYRQAFSLRQRMLDCIQHLEYYMMVEVIEPNWVTFLNKMSKVSNVDDVLSVHQDLQASYLKECMLTDPELLACITGICGTCIQFCDFMERMSRYYIDAELTSMIDEHHDEHYEHEDTKTKSTISSGSFEETIESLDGLFTDVLTRLLNRICALGRDNNNEKLLNVLCRLDFNLFYTQILIRKNAGKSQEENEISG
ncbi:hypothetical protein PV325_001615 [Microctonus aethiopoides]|nr:hypothetical protein PV325_001615 [Microctonus aethiopoides]KAK0091775.1 hypothetical protein PV326_002711 [Microctonus aethiopoides]